MPDRLKICCRAVVFLLAAALGAAQRQFPAPRDFNKDWLRCWERQRGEMRRAERQRRPFHLLLYGDSLVESWRGTGTCVPCNETIRSTCDGAPDLLQKYLNPGGRWRPGVFGIAGDQVANLQWRLQNGALPSKPQKGVAVLLIGTNDLGQAGRGKTGAAAAAAMLEAVPGVVKRVRRAADYVAAELPSAHVVVMALLPRGTTSATQVTPVSRNDFRWPSTYTPALRAVNRQLKAFVAGRRRLHFLDCGPRFLTHDRRAINKRLLPDSLHPGTAGHRALAVCMSSFIAPLMS